jgi:type I restriction enzyme S subunit
VAESERRPGPFPYFGANGQQGTIDDYIFDEPLLLLAEDGGHFDDPERGIAYRIAGKTWVNNHAHVIRSNGKLRLDYLCRVLENYDVRPFISGTTRGKLTKAAASQIPIPVAPIAEQRRIAAILDKADELRAKRRSALIELKGLSEAIFFDTFGDPRQNRAKWPIVPLGELCAKLVDGCHKTPTYVESGVPFITVSNIVSGTLDFKKTKFVSQDDHAVLTKRVKPERGDILVSKDGTIGVPCPIETDREFSIFVSVALLKTKSELVDYIFLTKQLETDWVQAQIRARTKGIAIRHLHLDDFKKLRILLPPLDLQKQFVRRIGAVGKLKAAHRASLADMHALFASLQHRSFQGEL